QVEPLYRHGRGAALARIGAAGCHHVIDAFMIAGRDVLPERVDGPARLTLLDRPGDLAVGSTGQMSPEDDQAPHLDGHLIRLDRPAAPSTIAHDTRVSTDPATNAVNCCVSSGSSVTVFGDRATESEATETTAVAEAAGWARLVATTWKVPAVSGAV